MPFMVTGRPPVAVSDIVVATCAEPACAVRSVARVSAAMIWPELFPTAAPAFLPVSSAVSFADPPPHAVVATRAAVAMPSQAAVYLGLMSPPCCEPSVISDCIGRRRQPRARIFRPRALRFPHAPIRRVLRPLPAECAIKGAARLRIP
ncbi:hypothetical protein GCM10010335_63040 [Streptomyces galbus]|nr:hypothetical protein GCM10010335_63040 [Streptomyces galbus]